MNDMPQRANARNNEPYRFQADDVSWIAIADAAAVVAAWVAATRIENKKVSKQ
jgi:hypothetical protein